jgi:MoaA/NifB/PqqE/SkfB family radical SAM enzyme
MRSVENSNGLKPNGQRLSFGQWLRYGPWLAQVVIIRKCNLSCGYCSEFDKTSDPVPFDILVERLEKLRELRTWAVCLTGGEPTLHPRLPDLLGEMKRLGFRRRQVITNGSFLNRELVVALNEAGLTDLQISVDGVLPNETTVKTLKPLRPKLEILAEHARFSVVMSGVIGSAPPAEALEVIDFAKSHGFSPRILLIHDETGRVKLTTEELAAYREARRRLGRAGNEAGNYRTKMIEEGVAPFRCRSGSRYLYVDEFGNIAWCSQTRGVYSKPLLDYTYTDLRAQFEEPKGCNPGCTVGCARTASAYDEWRPQRVAGAEPGG